MTIALAPTQTQIQTALRSFLLAVLPAGVEVVEGQDNRVPEPEGDDFVVMTALRRERIETNIDAYVDCSFVGAITATVLAVRSIALGSIVIGNQLFGTGVTPNTTISNQLTGPSGGVGTYTVSSSQTVASQTMASGSANVLQPTKITYQIDVHGSNGADNSQIISTLFRDEYAVEQFATSGVDVVPLYADDPRQMPFVNGEQQYEDRWIIEAVMQANQIVAGIPQQFADALSVDLVDVDASFPP